MEKHRKRSSKLKTAQTVTKAQVKQMLESGRSNLKKYTDSTEFSSGQGSQLDLTAFTMPTTGTGESSMTGVSIDVSAVEIHYEFTHPEGSATPDVYPYRITVVQAIGTGTDLTIGEIYQNASSAGTALVSPFRYDTLNKNFRVISDYKSWVDQYNPVKFHDQTVKIHTKARYDGLDADWATGKLYYVTVINNTAGHSVLDFNLYYRLWWYDV
jgi:hypothetical protein